jgi:S1-C subfamily serine protease
MRTSRRLGAATLSLALAGATVGGIQLSQHGDRAATPVVGALLALPAADVPTTPSLRSFGRQGGGGWGYPDDPSTGTSTEQQQQLDTTNATASASSGLVEISSTLGSGTAAGTGLVLSANGIVVTNHHVVEGSTAIKVTVVSTGRTYPARYVGSNSTKDVAVLRLIGARNLTTVELASSSEAATTGDKIIAVGDANGDGGSLTAATGMVTAVNQSITVNGDDGTTHDLTGLIEINADIVPGDSGGALLSSNGRVVGMNVAASSGTADITGYDIPITTVMSVVRAVEAGQASSSIDIGYDAYLGIGLYDDTSAPTIAGVVDGGAAAGAGLQAGDTITAVGGKTVHTGRGLRLAIAEQQPGESVRVSWPTADGAKHSTRVTLDRAPIA